MPSMVRTEICVPAGMVTFVAVCVLASILASVGRKLNGRGAVSPSDVLESNLTEATSATSYFCTDDPTRKLISFSVPPINLPLIRLPFFSSNESAHAADVSRQMATTKRRLRLKLGTVPLAPASNRAIESFSLPQVRIRHAKVENVVRNR